jgi:hypothetical protein
MASPRQFKSSRLQERQAKEIEEARIRRRNAIANYWKHAYGNTSVCIESGESACKRIKVDVNCSDSHFDYSIYPDLIPFALPNEVEEYSLPKEFIDDPNRYYEWSEEMSKQAETIPAVEAMQQIGIN